MILGALRVSYYLHNESGRYSTPSAWRAGEQHPNNLRTLGFREALNYDFRLETNHTQEVWLYPLAAQGGPVLRPAKSGARFNFDIIERELGVSLYTSGVFIDLDDKPSHEHPHLRTDQSWFERVEAKIAQYLKISGAFYYRTLRGARFGFIFQEPVEITLGDRARKGLFTELVKTFEDDETVDVDAASTQITRGFAAPLIYKKGERIPDDFPCLQIHPDDMPLELIEFFASRWDAHLKNTSVQANSERRSEDAPSATAPKGAEDQASRTPKGNKKPRVIIPHNLESLDLDRTTRHDLFRDFIYKMSFWVQCEPMLLEFSHVADKYLCDGRRTEKGEALRYVTEMLAAAPKHELDEDHSAVAPPPPLTLPDFPDLAPLRRLFSFPRDDLSIAQAVLDAMGVDPLPIWHGDGLRQYSPTSGTWKIYRKPQLEQILTKLEGAQAENAKGEFSPIPINMQLINGAVNMIKSVTASSESETPFDTAPMGVVLGEHFISAGQAGLKVSPKDAKFYAIHHLDYDLSPQLLQFWEDEDTGREPAEPKIFIDTFLKRSLHRDPHEDETTFTVESEINAKITTIGEWIGLALLGLCTREATALVCFGEGSNGKSVLASLISDLFGAERTAHLAPQAMKERFSRAQLFGAAVNVVSEMPETDLLESDTLKAMISGDAITVEHKNEKPFRMRPRAAHFFAANKLPASRDRSHGLWRRLVPIEFHHIFSGHERDPDLLDKLRSEYHLIVPWALDLARVYIERQGYAHQDYIDVWRGNWRIETDALSAWIALKCQVTSEDELMTAQKLWQDFRGWAEDVGQSGAAKMSLNAFSRSISAQPHVKKFRRREKGAVRSSSPVTQFNIRIIEDNGFNDGHTTTSTRTAH